MDPHSATAVAPLRLLDLPREVRDDIYEAVIFDLSPPDMFMKIDDPDSTQLRKMDTNILLTNRQMYWEARDVIIHRGQLIMVSTSFQDLKTIETCLMHTSGITPIDPIYRNLCIMSHHSRYLILTYTFFQIAVSFHLQLEVCKCRDAFMSKKCDVFANRCISQSIQPTEEKLLNYMKSKRSGVSFFIDRTLSPSVVT